MTPVDCKISNFSLYLFVYLNNYFLACAQLLISGKPISQYVSYSLIFTPSRSIINGEQYESISTINPAIA